MILSRWAAASTLLVLMMVGCTKTQQVDPNPTPVATSDEIAAAKARYAAYPNVLVGEVEGADATNAAVSGLDPKTISKDDVLSFIDVPTGDVISHGTLTEARPSGRLVVEYDQQGTRPPRKGDLCVKLAAK